MQLEKNVLDNGVIVLKLAGRLDIQGAGEVETKFAAESVGDKAAVVVDMAGVEFLASIGIRMLLVNAKTLNGRGGKMALLNPIPMVLEALEVAGIDTLIPIYTDLDTAAAELKAAVS